MKTASEGNDDFTASSMGFSAATQSGHLEKEQFVFTRIVARHLPTVTVFILGAREQDENPFVRAVLLQRTLELLVTFDRYGRTHLQNSGKFDKRSIGVRRDSMNTRLTFYCSNSKSNRQ